MTTNTPNSRNWTYPTAPYEQAPPTARPAAVPQGQPKRKGRLWRRRGDTAPGRAAKS